MGAFPKEEEARAALINCVADLDEQEVLDFVRLRIICNEYPLRIVEDCQKGMRQVGERYERR